jgi:ribosomal-protein-alanine N-acetyltransferase
MTPQEMSALHVAAFAPDRGWSASEFADLSASPYVTCYAVPNGFALVRSIAGEAELLTLAVAPQHRRQGIGYKLLEKWLQAEHAERVFLEVASDNPAAMALYEKSGFAVIGLRKAYYARTGRPDADAVLMQRTMTHRK